MIHFIPLPQFVVIDRPVEQRDTGLYWKDGTPIVAVEQKDFIGFYELHEQDDTIKWQAS